MITPLVFSKYIESCFELAKKSSLIALGGIFIILTITYLLMRTYGKDADEKNVFIDKKIDPAIFFFLLAAFISTILSIKPYVSFHGQYTRQIGFITFLYLSIIYFLSSQIFREGNKVDFILKIMEFTGVAAALYAFLQYFHLDPFETPLSAGIKPVSTLGHNTFAAGFMVMLFPFSLIRIFRDEKPYLGIAFSFILVCGIVISQSRASYAAALAALGVVLMFYPFLYKGKNELKFRKFLKTNLSVISGVIIILVLLVMLMPSNPFVEKFIRIMDLPNTARWLLWRDSIEAYKIHPFFGSGIATFPSVFEYVISYELKAIEPRNYFDHAHNVFIHTLVTMGAVGLAAYVVMLFTGFVSSLKAYFNNSIEKNGRLFFLSIIASLTGYVIYSLADFEDISIFLYLFIIFAMLKVMYAKYNITAAINNIKTKNSFMYIATVLSVGVILCCVYNFYVTYNDIESDIHYKAGKELYLTGDVKGSIDELNKSVTINYGCAEYKFTLANYVQEFCLKNQGMNAESKNNLLRQAEEELERAKPNFFSQLQYQALRTIIKLQQGDTLEAGKLKAKIFKEDSLIINFRNNLARYYFVKQDTLKMKNELRAVLSQDPYNTDATLISASYYLSVNDKKSALDVCDNLLKKYPQEPLINKLKQQLINSP